MQPLWEDKEEGLLEVEDIHREGLIEEEEVEIEVIGEETLEVQVIEEGIEGILEGETEEDTEVLPIEEVSEEDQDEAQEDQLIN